MPISFKTVARNVCAITINRPAKRNALNLDGILKLKQAVHRFEEDRDLYVAVIRGSGGYFCSGYDVNELIEPESGLANLDRIEQMLWPLGQRISEKKLTVAAIDGYAVGFGLELALKCDFRIAESSSRLGFFNRRLGIPIMNGGTVILPKMIGLSRATEIIFTGRAFPGPQSLTYGMISSSCDVGCAFGNAVNYARSLAKFNQSALLHDVRSTLRYLDDDLKLHEDERSRSLEYLKHCGPLDMVAKFIRGELFRHGNTDMGNLISPDPEMTL